MVTCPEFTCYAQVFESCPGGRRFWVCVTYAAPKSFNEAVREVIPDLFERIRAWEYTENDWLRHQAMERKYTVAQKRDLTACD